MKREKAGPRWQDRSDHMPGPDLRARVTQARYEDAHGSKKRAKRLWRSARKAAIKLLRSGKPFSHLEKTCHISRQWLHKWWNRWITGGKQWTALDEASSRPHTIHTKRGPFVDEILEARDQYGYGAHKLQHILGLKGTLSHATVHEVLRQAGRVKPARKRRKKNWTRFQRSQPNHLWQLDVTQWPLNDGEGPKAWILSAIDDHSRFLLGTQVHDKELNAGDTVRFLKAMFSLWGTPQEILTDNGSEFENNGDVLSLMVRFLYKHGVKHIPTRPQHPRCIGKIERWHRSLKEEWLRRVETARSMDELHGLLMAWLVHYNTVRPHWAIELATPVEAYTGGFIPPHGFRRFVNEVR